MKKQKFSLRLTEEQAAQVNAKIVEQFLEYGSIPNDAINLLKCAEVLVEDDGEE